jgi:phosphoribosylaminoimidazole-succinocarboxamide synthase
MEGKDPYGLNLPSGLPLMHAFPKPISTPTEKSATDDPRNFQEIAELYPVETDITDIVYKTGSDFLLTKGIRLIDGKSEASGFMLADDWLNGDCCRMARVEDIQEGIEPPFLDKENFRKTALRKWNGGPKVPLTFNQAETRDGLAGYHQAFEMITGQSISDFRRKFYS